jgi:DNA-binding IclR family transcriptional regulator
MAKVQRADKESRIVTLDQNRQAGAQSLYRAIAVIKAVAQYDEKGVRMATLARKIDLPTSTVHRLLTVLVSEDFVEYDFDTKKYHIGYGLYLIGEKARKFDIREKYHSALKNVSEKTGETSYLVTRSGNDALCLDRIVGSYPIQVLTFEIGACRVLGIGAASLAILSSLPDEICNSIIEANAEKYSGFMGITKDDVYKMVLKTRRDKFSLSSKIVNAETIGVGVPIVDEKGNVLGAISATGILSRMKPDRRQTIVEIIRSEIASAG